MLLDYSSYTSVAGGMDVMDKVRQYAVSAGWTQQSWRENYDWFQDPDYGDPGHDDQWVWTASTGSGMVELSSTGYGTTALKFSMAITLPLAGGHIHRYAHLAAQISQNLTWDGSDGTHPYAQSSYRPNSTDDYYAERMPEIDLGSATIDRMWIFGDDKWICCVCDMDGNFVQAFHFGQYPMFESAPVNGMVLGHHAQFNATYAPTLWEHHCVVDGTVTNPAKGCPWWPGVYDPYSGREMATLDFIYSDVGGAGSSAVEADGSTRIACNVYPVWGSDANEFGTYDRMWKYVNGLAEKTTVEATSLPNLWKALNLNAYSTKRVMMKPVYFYESDADGTWKPFATSPIYIIPFGGLSIGETLTYGSEQYICFPIAHVRDQFGYAMRIV